MGGNILEYEAKTILNRGRAEGIKEGIREGRMEGVLSTLSELVQKGLLDIRDAAEQASMTVEEFEIKTKELIGALR